MYIILLHCKAVCIVEIPFGEYTQDGLCVPMIQPTATRGIFGILYSMVKGGRIVYMDGKTAAYTIDVSVHSRDTLDNEAAELFRERMANDVDKINPYATHRVPLRQLFHKNYDDQRPEWLVSARVWGVEDRKYRTVVMLTKSQIADILELSLNHNIDPRPFATNTMNPSGRGVVRYLLSTFLEAVINKHLVKKADNVG